MRHCRPAMNLDLERFILRDSALASLTLLAKMREIPFDDRVMGLAELQVVSPTVGHAVIIVRSPPRRATAFSPRRKPWERRRLQNVFKPRKGRHHLGSGRCPTLPAGLCRPYRGLRSRTSSFFSHGFRRGLIDDARPSGLSGISDRQVNVYGDRPLRCVVLYLEHVRGVCDVAR